ncbi:hypothetical protein AUJ14_05470 [Candidatus Micrarchaeota archaeon CG1_02_55_22]|nr:MAG: hypothetical protein AUJ14_05470 [Candidatus Micrarchaeota archaeon CG1_02_55_22]
MQPLLVSDIAITIIAAAVASGILYIIRQPPVLAYLLAGIVIGPAVLGLVSDAGNIYYLSEIGVAFVLFAVGMELDAGKLKELGNAGLIGIGQMVLTFLAAALLASAAGFGQTDAAIIALAVTMSSTMIVAKLLGEKRELDTLHGRLALGILLVQDVAVILALSVMSFSGGSATLATIVYALAALGALLAVAALAAPRIFAVLARSQETLFIAALAWCFLFSYTALQMGFSIAIGGFLAGLSLSRTPYKLELASRIAPLRDFFATLFFTSLGMQIAFGPLEKVILPAIAFAAFVAIAKPFIIMAISSLKGYASRASFMAGASLGQVSEFSLILAGTALSTKTISPEAGTLITATAVITLASSGYVLKHLRGAYTAIGPKLTLFDAQAKRFDLDTPKHRNHSVILFGCHRAGYHVARELKKKILAVDFDPEVVENLKRQGVDAIYGDAADPELLSRVNFYAAKLVISTIPDDLVNHALLAYAKKQNPKIRFISTAIHSSDAQSLYDKGADYVHLQQYASGQAMANAASRTLSKPSHLAQLRKRHRTGINEYREFKN